MTKNQGNEDDIHIHVMSAQDYAIEMGNQLEDANYHSISGLPERIYGILSKHINDNQLIAIMKEFYEQDVFLD